MAGMFSQFKGEGKEGVVFKHIDAPYIPGKPNAGGTQLKYKFYETASFIVAKVNDKRSVSLILFEGDKVRGRLEMSPSHPTTIFLHLGLSWNAGISTHSRNQAPSTSLFILGRVKTSSPPNAPPPSSNTKLSHELEPSRCFV
jgi:hypothetical protein